MKDRKPSFILSATPIAVLVALLSATLIQYGSDALTGPSQICLLVASAVCISIAIGVYHVKWDDIEKQIQANIHDTAVSICILLIIGALSGAWMMSGVVPTLVYYGVQIIHPMLFLPLACILTAIVSVVTGSSWTTIATIGIALLGIGRTEGFSDGWIAGAIISGAYFGDKISPLSDTTVLASSVCRVPLFEHIRFMMHTTIPSFCIALIVFAVAGIYMSAGEEINTAELTQRLDCTFNITGWLMIVPIATGWLIYKRVPSLVVLFASCVMAIVAAVICQPHIVYSIATGNSIAFGNFSPETADFGTTFRGTMQILCHSCEIDTGSEMLNELVTTKGMAGMLNTVWLILCAMCFGGAMAVTGMLRTFLTTIFDRLTHSRFGLVFATTCNSIFMNLATGDQYISIILSASMFRDSYEREGYDGRLLSRTCEDSATVTSVLIPWNTCGMTQSTVLGVATITYLPYCVFNYLSPLTTLAAAAFWNLRKKKAEVQEQ